MFAITQRLLLRPAWLEDAPELAAAIGHESVVRNLARAPWPYALSDAETFLAAEPDIDTPTMLITDRVEHPGRIVGCIGIDRMDNGDIELGYWLTPDYWGRGLVTEAGHAVLDAATTSLGHRRFTAGHFVDNPASGNVLRKLGFRPTGRIEPRHSKGRGSDAECVLYELDADEDLAGLTEQPALAA